MRWHLLIQRENLVRAAGLFNPHAESEMLTQQVQAALSRFVTHSAGRGITVFCPSMSGGNASQLLRGILAIVLSVHAAIASAGPLAEDSNALGGIWHNSTPFQAFLDYPNTSVPSTLSGRIDWAVYGPGDFPPGYADYIPAANEYVYAYQVILDEAATAHTFVEVHLEVAVNNVGTFIGDGGFGQIDGGSALSSYLYPNNLVPVSAGWLFDGSRSTGSTRGLAFTSPHPPQLLTGTIGFESGEATRAIGDVVPLPSPSAIPEPPTLLLAGIGLVSWLTRCGLLRKILN